MIVWQWPFESFPRLVIRQGCLSQPSRVTPAQDLKFQRRFYLCHSTRSVNTPSVNLGSAYPPVFRPKGPGPEGLARPVRVCARALDRGVGPSGMTMTFLDRWPNFPPPLYLGLVAELIEVPDAVELGSGFPPGVIYGHTGWEDSEDLLTGA